MTPEFKLKKICDLGMCPIGFSMCQGYSDTSINTSEQRYRFGVLLADGKFPLEAEQPAVSLSSFFMKGLFKKKSH